MFPTDRFKIFTLFNHPFIYLFSKNQFCCHTSWKFHLECINLILSHEHGQHIFDFWIYHRKSTILDITHVHKSILHWLEPCPDIACIWVFWLSTHPPKTHPKKKKKHTHTHTTIWGEENSLRSRVPLNRASKNHFSLLAPQTKQTRLPSHPLLSLSLSLSLCFWFLLIFEPKHPNPTLTLALIKNSKSGFFCIESQLELSFCFLGSQTGIFWGDFFLGDEYNQGAELSNIMIELLDSDFDAYCMGLSDAGASQRSSQRPS